MMHDATVQDNNQQVKDLRRSNHCFVAESLTGKHALRKWNSGWI